MRLHWAESIGGLQALFARADANARVLLDWAERTPWLENLAVDPATRSNTSVCLKIVDPAVARLPLDAQRAFVKQLEAMLDKENAARDIAGHRDAPPSLAHLVRLDGRGGRCRGAHALARLGLRRGQGRPRQGGVNQGPLPSKRATRSTRAGGLRVWRPQMRERFGNPIAEIMSRCCNSAQSSHGAASRLPANRSARSRGTRVALSRRT